MGKSIIKKGIVRGIQTKQYEQVTITVETQEMEVEWENLEERKKKSDKITKVLLEDFKNTFNEVVNTLGVDRCIGNVKLKGGKPEKTSNNSKDDDDELDLFD